MPTMTHNESEKPIVISATDARGGVISGRVITVLICSLLLAAAAMIGMLAYFYSYWPFV